MKDPSTRAIAFPSPSPSSSSTSSSEFEFVVALSPTSRNSSSSKLCPADELFCRGRLLPLHLSPRLSMLRNILLAPSCDSSSDAATTSRDSTSSSASDFSSLASSSARPSSAASDEEYRPASFRKPPASKLQGYFFSKLASVFHRRQEKSGNPPAPASKKISESAKEAFRKCVKKVKPLCERLRPRQIGMPSAVASCVPSDRSLMGRAAAAAVHRRSDAPSNCSQSFSGNLGYPRGRRRRRSSYTASCPSSVASSPARSSAEDLQSAIEGAISHCKRSMNV